jgi:hypothetical protein
MQRRIASLSRYGPFARYLLGLDAPVGLENVELGA